MMVERLLVKQRLVMRLLFCGSEVNKFVKLFSRTAEGFELFSFSHWNSPNHIFCLNEPRCLLTCKCYKKMTITRLICQPPPQRFDKLPPAMAAHPSVMWRRCQVVNWQSVGRKAADLELRRLVCVWVAAELLTVWLSGPVVLTQFVYHVMEGGPPVVSKIRLLMCLLWSRNTN